MGGGPFPLTPSETEPKFTRHDTPLGWGGNRMAVHPRAGTTPSLERPWRRLGPPAPESRPGPTGSRATGEWSFSRGRAAWKRRGQGTVRGPWLLSVGGVWDGGATWLFPSSASDLGEEGGGPIASPPAWLGAARRRTADVQVELPRCQVPGLTWSRATGPRGFKDSCGPSRCNPGGTCGCGAASSRRTGSPLPRPWVGGGDSRAERLAMFFSPNGAV